MPQPLPELLPLLQAGGGSLATSVPVAELRAASDAGVVAAASFVRPSNGAVAVTRHEAGDRAVPVTLYRPASAPVRAGLHVHLHGGGWWMGSTATADAMCRELAAASGLVVASVDYALAPERPWPAAPEDCYAALTWLVASAEQLGMDATSVSVGGESAGANLAAVVTLMARDRSGPALVGQWLDVPAVDLALPTTPSQQAFGRGFGLDTEDCRRIIEWYLAGRDATDPLVSPARAALHHLPPALVTVAELDPLRDQGLRYADALAAAGTRTEVLVSDGHLHGTTWLTALTPSAATWHEVAVGFLRRAHAAALVEGVPA